MASEKREKMTQALAKTNEEQSLTKAVAVRFKDVQSVLPKHMTPERMCRIAVAAVTHSPDLIEAARNAPETVVAAVVEAASLGLEPLSILGHAYLVPRWNSKTNRKEVSLQIGYRGFIELASRSGRVQTIIAELVYPEDEFKVQMGTDPQIVHVPNFARASGSEPVCCYAVAKFKDGAVAFRVLTVADIERIRACSDSWRSYTAKKIPEAACPWAGPHKYEMWRKSAVRQLAKYLPLSPELVAAAVSDEQREAGLDVSPSEMLALQDNRIVALPETTEPQPESKPEETTERVPGQEG